MPILTMKIGARIALIAIIPLLALTIGSSLLLIEKQHQKTASNELRILVGVATNLSALIHEMQKERGISSVFLGSRGEQMASALPEQKNKVDQGQTVATTAFDALNTTSYGLLPV